MSIQRQQDGDPFTQYMEACGNSIDAMYKLVKWADAQEPIDPAEVARHVSELVESSEWMRAAIAKGEVTGGPASMDALLDALGELSRILKGWSPVATPDSREVRRLANQIASDLSGNADWLASHEETLASRQPPPWTRQ
jgi:hypothetical protein